MARAAWLALLALLVPTLSGCLSFLSDEDGADDGGVRPADVGYDASAIKVNGVAVHEAEIESFDGTMLSAIIYEPLSRAALPNGSAPTWPVVVMLHGWGFAKEQWTHLPMGVEEGQPPVDLMDRFARAGFLTVAYDARGFGRSGGTTTVAGPLEMADLDAVIQYTEDHFAASGLVGVTGTSYGGGQSLLGLVKNPRITTAASHYGWMDLYDGVLPGNVPKLEWAQFLYLIGVAGTGVAGSGGMLTQWYTSLYTREGLDDIHAAMDARSAEARLPHTLKPAFLCQGMQETLFPQQDRVVEAAAGFTRSYVFTGGHSALHEPCWDRTIDWFRFWLRGIDTEVDAWPALETVDASDDEKWVKYDPWPPTRQETYYLRDGLLGDFAASNSTFTIEQRPFANPFNEPAVVWESLGAPTNAIPEQFRQDPAGVWFYGEPMEESQSLVGAPVLTLQVENGTAPPFQVVGNLYKQSEGRLQLLSRGAFAALDADDIQNDTVALRFDWVKADLVPGDALALKLAPNDPSMYMPLLANYEVTFTGHSSMAFDHFLVTTDPSGQ